MNVAKPKSRRLFRRRFFAGYLGPLIGIPVGAGLGYRFWSETHTISLPVHVGLWAGLGCLKRT